jgi:RNA polymerase sigma-70 factor, ECF subfamily
MNSPSTHPSLFQELQNPENREEAWRKFVEQYHPLLLAWGRKQKLNDTDAEDVAADVLTKLTKALLTFQYDPEKRFRFWLKTVVGNAVKDFWRSRQRSPGAQGAGGSEVAILLEQAPDQNEVDSLAEELNSGFEKTQRQMDQVLDTVQTKVEPHVWQAFTQVVLEKKTAKEVAANLQIPVAYVYIYKGRVAKMLSEEKERQTEEAAKSTAEFSHKHC